MELTALVSRDPLPVQEGRLAAETPQDGTELEILSGVDEDVDGGGEAEQEVAQLDQHLGTTPSHQQMTEQ